MRKIGFLALATVLLAGCSTKGVDSYLSSTTPNPKPTWGGDKYASGGKADATGGLQTKTRHGEGAKTGLPTGR